MSMSTVLSGRSGFSCDFKKTEDFFAKDPKLAGVRHASAFSREMRGGGGRAVGFNQPDFAKRCKDVKMVFEVLNEVYFQIFLHRWVVNRETNLMMLINSCLINN